MGFNNLARQPGAGTTAISCAGGILVRQPDDGTIQDLKRADQFIPFSPETFLDELVQIFAVTESGASLSPMQFRALPADVRASVAAAFLEHFAGADAEAILPRAAGESDAAYLLRFWRHGKLRAGERAPMAPRGVAEPRQEPVTAPTAPDESKLSAGSLGQMDLARLRLVPMPLREPPAALSPDLSSLNVTPSEALGLDAASGDAPPSPLHMSEPAAMGETIGGPLNRPMVAPMVAEAPAPRGNGAMLVALIAVLLALGGIGAGALLFVRQDSANQRMIATMRQRQDALEEANRDNRQTIDSLNDALRRNASAAAAPAPASTATADAAAPNLRSASTSGTPHATPRTARAARAKEESRDDDALNNVLDSASGGNDEAMPPTTDSQYVDPRYGDPRYAGPQYPVRRGDVPAVSRGY